MATKKLTLKGEDLDLLLALCLIGLEVSQSEDRTSKIHFKKDGLSQIRELVQRVAKAMI